MKVFRNLLKYLIVFAFLFSQSLVFSKDLTLQKALVYQGDEKITGFYMSEKLDGIRGYWDGEKLLTRSGKLINTPKWFIENFPPFELDGELWSKRNDFEFIQSAVLKKIPTDSWEKITYNIFEVPNTKGDFSKRLEKANKWFETNPNKNVKIIPQIICTGKDHLNGFLKKIESKGGEGVILKDPSQNYHNGKIPYILKVKNFSKMEGIVIGINKGKGKYKNMMGSLKIKLDNGIIFNLGSGFSDLERANPPKINSRVVFKHYGFTKNKIPKFPSFLDLKKE
ncbi:MAG: DNA ligase [Desulforegulaceae bacterium]|nr:DNA ligase [Desulforegulaceae bacterium]